MVLGDLAAVEVAAENPTEACHHISAALDELDRTWYAVAMDRIRDVRRRLHRWQDDPCVRDLDDRLFGWDATLSAIRS
ncbi:MAG TPA: hypothetical protein VEZ42_19630 [Pseudonocardia sp.]|nr:hypothetical protein [Pseudonocardia sp.]